MKINLLKGVQFKFLMIFILSIICASLMMIVFQITLSKLLDLSDHDLARIEEQYTFVYFLVFLIFTTITFMIFSRTIIRRIEQLNAYANSVKKGNFDSLIEIKTNDEVGELSQNICLMVETIKDSLEKQKQSEQARNEMISNISHDLRTPLTSLSGYIELAKLNLDNPSLCHDYIEVLEAKCESLKNQVNDLLEYANLNDKNINIQMEKVSVQGLIEQVMIDFIPQLEKNSIQFALDRQDEKLYIHADISLFVRLLQNVISNSIHYGKSGKKIKVEVLLKQTNVIINIINYGEAIAKEDLPYIFERFYRGEKSRNEHTGGKGMGLAVAQSIAKLHSGSIDVISNEVETVFTISIPRYEKS
ncbi:cell wall metabolism sensor histidine kinase WalK [Bacillus sp. WMMC1349]|uniref:sensor histidine kinase n=1 Tax=Bacillus sp. WMMC1349 TaxID=2736254 RepID=UPI0020A6C09D|nr:HAMP domain-containing sensor histidine kinase [Bacillus sp. WMMC1349]